MAGENGSSTGDIHMFAIFGFSVLALLLIPTTVWRIRAGAGSEPRVVKPWEKAPRKTFKSYVNGVNIVLAVLWAALAVLGLLILTMKRAEDQHFDPFEILGVSSDLSEAEIVKVYRNLTRIWHPDRSKAPNAAEVFDRITKAKNALVDPVSRENWEKHGHPDGPQAMTIGVAMPDWLFASGVATAPLALLALATVGLAAPIVAISWYLHSTEGYVGANRVAEATLVMFARFMVKEAVKLPKMPESLMPAQEFTRTALKPPQKEAFKEFASFMSRTFGLGMPEGRDKPPRGMPKWWKRSQMRSFLYLTAFLERRGDAVPAALRADYAAVVRTVPMLCEEFAKVASAPRVRGRGWFTPGEAAAQMQQCAVQQIPPATRTPTPEEKKKKSRFVGDAAAALLQLEGLEEEAGLELSRGQKIKTLEDLAGLPLPERQAALDAAKVPPAALPGIEAALLALPHVHVTSLKVFVEGEDDIRGGDIVTFRAHLALTRAAHLALPGGAAAAAAAARRAAAVAAYAPRAPAEVTEKWHVFLANTRSAPQLTWGHTIMSLAEAEAVGAERAAELGCRWAPAQRREGGAEGGAAANGGVPPPPPPPSAPGADTKDETSSPEAEPEEAYGQKVEFKAYVADPGKYNLQMQLMPTCWLGCDVVVPVAFTVLRQAEEEKGGQKGRGAVSGDAAGDNGEGDGEDGEDDEDDSDEDDDGEAWDTDETGTDVTHDDDDKGEGEGEGNGGGNAKEETGAGEAGAGGSGKVASAGASKAEGVSKGGLRQRR